MIVRAFTIYVSICALQVRAEVMEFTSRASWENAVGRNYSTIDFTGFADGTSIDDEFIDMGVTFTTTAYIFQSAGFLNDGWGLHGPGGTRFAFSLPQNWVGIDHPGVAQIQLFYQGGIVYSSSLFFQGGLGNFSGLVSSTPFDEVYIFKPPPYENQVAIDDLHWGGVPGPGALGLAAIAGAITSRRKRRK